MGSVTVEPQPASAMTDSESMETIIFFIFKNTSYVLNLSLSAVDYITGVSWCDVLFDKGG